MMRLFVAIALPDRVRDRLSGLCSGLKAARWITPENMHLTLRFVGEVEPAAAEDIDAALSAIDAPAFDLALSGVGTFGPVRKARALWAGVARSEPLAFLREKVESAVVRAGLPPESRKFKPHVTLARFRSSPGPQLTEWLAANDAFMEGPLQVDRFVLFRSHLGSERAHYETLAEYELSPT